ncbi:MAG: transcriptional regulator [Thaumarchaeota archaeon]|jgi:DNA polymerase III delta prime subunit|nr:transcriptional regulator [Nitrososphaerota archaeon]
MLVTDEEFRGKVLAALADEYSKKILSATIQNAMSVLDLSGDNQIPKSSAYKRVRELHELGLLAVEKSVISDEGKRFELYRSTAKRVDICFNLGDVEIEIIPNDDMATQFARLWTLMKGM